MEIYFTKEHEWVKIEDNTGTIGITAYAAHQLGDITFVELPKIGKVVKKGGVFSTIESVKAASDIYAPMSGKVIEANKELDTAPQIVNDKAESDGWIAKIELSDSSEKNGLMNQALYEEYLKENS
jgi:glycine cleavage system H protein